MFSSKINKKGQISDTVTWVVATIIILVVLIFFLVGASLLADTKNIQKYRPTLTSLSSIHEEVDSSMLKSIFTCLKIEDTKEKLLFYQVLVEQEEEGKFLESLESKKSEVEFKSKSIK
jgi:hypothetical protein